MIKMASRTVFSCFIVADIVLEYIIARIFSYLTHVAPRYRHSNRTMKNTIWWRKRPLRETIFWSKNNSLQTKPRNMLAKKIYIKPNPTACPLFFSFREDTIHSTHPKKKSPGFSWPLPVVLDEMKQTKGQSCFIHHYLTWVSVLSLTIA